MKKLLITLFLTITALCYGQNNNTPKCFADQLLQSAIAQNPEISSRMDELNQRINARQNGFKLKNFSPVTIPVVIYVVHANGQENISDEQVISQIDALNDYYQGTGFNFCIATKKGNGSIPNNGFYNTQDTPGIIHVQNFNLTTHDIESERDDLMALASSTPSSQYLRIWVVKDIYYNGPSNILGYTMFPEATDIFDGIVVKASVFGNADTCTSCYLPNGNYKKGKTLAHEMGHYFTLYHTFEGACGEIAFNDCENYGDHVCDTPPVATPNFACTTGTDSCDDDLGLPDDIHNFMDYGSDECVDHFTQGQMERMQAALLEYRSSLIQTDNLIYTGACGTDNYISATFTASTYMACNGTTIFFTPLQNNLNYEWNFGDPSSGANNTSQNQNASHTFSSSDTPYMVTLTVTDNNNNTAFTSAMIFVTDCTPITSTAGNWYFSDYNGLNFSSGIPVYDNGAEGNTPYLMVENSAVQSNQNGNLLFYTNGRRIWNNQHAVINESNLLLGHPSSLHGTLIVPQPNDNSHYYIFTKTFDGQPNGFRYSIVDINGTNTTLSSTVNEPVTTPSGYLTGNNGAIIGSEGIGAVASCNGHWILTVNYKSSGYFLTVYSLTATGLSFTSEIALPSSITAQRSSIEASPDGNKIALLAPDVNEEEGGTIIYDFNKTNGTLSNPVTIDITDAWGASFSPNSKLLYITRRFNNMIQYNIFAPPGENIKYFANTTSAVDIQRGPDNKIYFSLSSSNQLGVIYEPDNALTGENTNACMLSLNGPILGTSNGLSLPNMIDATQNTAYNNTISYSATNCYDYRFTGNICTSGYNWNFGDPSSGASNSSALSNPTHTFSQPGTYTVTLSSDSGSINTQITVGGSAPVIVGNTTACVSDNNQTAHSINIPENGSVVWTVSGGSILGLNTNSGILVNWSSLPGTVEATTTDPNGCVYTMQQIVTSYCTGDVCPPNIQLNTPDTATSDAYKASYSIVTENNYRVNPGSAIEMFAQEFIVLKPNTWVRNGSEYLAQIQPCEGSRELLDEQDLKNTYLTAYPNPTKGELQISGKPISRVEIFDLLGKQVFSSDYENLSEVSVNMSNFNEGLYLVRVTIDSGTIESFKIIKEQ